MSDNFENKQTDDTTEVQSVNEEKIMLDTQSDEEIKKDIEADKKPKSKNIFAKNSGLNRFMAALGNLILVNMLFIVTSIPIITMGASLVAINTIVIKIKEEDDFVLVPLYFKTFARNFWDATFPWIISLGIMSAAVFGVYQCVTTGNGWGNILGAGGCGIIGVVILGFMTYYFMLVSRYEGTVTQHIANAFKCSVIYFFRSVPIWGIWVIAILPFVVLDWLRWYGGWLWLMVGFAGVIYLTSPFYRKIFHLLETKEVDD